MRISRLLAAVLLAYGAGFGVFVAAQPGPADDRATDAIIVPTGAAGRIDRGLAVLRRGGARRMLVTGVAPETSGVALARQYRVPLRMFACCVDLGRDAVDTRGNADEAVAWIRQHRYRSVRLVTSSWHLARARMELTHALGDGVTVLGDAVPSSPRATVLFGEYNKLLLRWIALRLGITG